VRQQSDLFPFSGRSFGDGSGTGGDSISTGSSNTAAPLTQIRTAADASRDADSSTNRLVFGQSVTFTGERHRVGPRRRHAQWDHVTFKDGVNEGIKKNTKKNKRQPRRLGTLTLNSGSDPN